MFLFLFLLYSILLWASCNGNAVDGSKISEPLQANKAEGIRRASLEQSFHPTNSSNRRQQLYKVIWIPIGSPDHLVWLGWWVVVHLSGLYVSVTAVQLAVRPIFLSLIAAAVTRRVKAPDLNLCCLTRASRACYIHDRVTYMYACLFCNTWCYSRPCRSWLGPRCGFVNYKIIVFYECTKQFTHIILVSPLKQTSEYILCTYCG